MKETLLKAIELPNQNSFPERKYLAALLKDYENNRIDRIEFMAGLLEWSWEFAYTEGGYMVNIAPYKPTHFAAFERMTKEEIKALPAGAWSKYKEKRGEWSGEVSKARVYNRSSRDWLTRMYLYFKNYKKDTYKSGRIAKRLKMFEGEC